MGYAFHLGPVGGSSLRLNLYQPVFFFLPLIPERGLEDHEFVVEVQEAWPVGGDSRFIFRKNFAKYELFKSPPVSVYKENLGRMRAQSPPPLWTPAWILEL